MDSLFQRLPAHTDDDLVNVVVDTPKGSRNKYRFDEDAGAFALSRVLPAGMAFPHDFGSVPKTLAEDGDPLDVMVLSQSPSFPGCLLRVRLIGTIGARQTEKGKTVRNDRLLGVPVTKVNDPDFSRLDELPKAWIEEIEHFLRSYNEAQGRRFETISRGGPRRAKASLKDAERRYQKEHT